MVNRTLNVFLLLVLLVIVSTPCSSQDNVNNDRSKTIENLNGKPYYIHFVKEGQTIFGISKLYDVTAEVLIANNPDLKNGLKADMILTIPVKDTVVVAVKSKPVPVQESPKPVLVAESPKIVVPKENPKPNLITDSPKPVPIVVKKEPVIETPTVTVSPHVKSVGLIVYGIKRGETLYGIAKRYDVSMDEILNANPGITSFRAGTKLRIPVIQRNVIQSAAPVKTEKAVVGNPKPVEVKTAVVNVPVNAVPISDPQVKELGGIYKVALLIPFYLDEIDSIRADQTEPKSFSFVQFYEASLLAVDSLKKQGMDVKLYVYDSDGDARVDKTKAIFQKKELAEMDLIIGPFYAKCFEIASKYAGLHKIPIVNPLAKRDEIITAKPWVFKAQPGVPGQMGEVAEFVNKHFTDANIVVVTSDRMKMAPEATAFKAEIKSSLKKENKIPVIRECFFVTEGLSGLKLKLVKDKPNVLVVLSGEEVFVSGLLRNLDEISGDYDVTVMGMAAWEQYKLDINSMMHAKLHLFSNKYIDFSYLPVQKFSDQFNQAYYTLPEVKEYGFDGFDITYFFLSSLMKYGRQFGRQVEEYNYQGLQDSFRFHKIEGGGYVNSAVNFYRFENNNLKRVD